ncbi:MAG: tRNA pseudouridine(38-40) synthase TruA [bacterium]
MRNIKLTIEYDGTDFCGWQYQPNLRTVQGEIENAIKKITNEDTRIIGAGRTDQGVHALGQVANFKTDSRLTLDQFQKGINALIGDDIYIKEIDEVDEQFHARFSARSKIYRYSIMLKPSPLLRRYNWYVPFPLDIELMKKTLPQILGAHDFRHFSAHNDNETAVCTITNLSLVPSDSQIFITIEADRFLHKMVRGLVGFLVDIGRGRFSSSDTNRVFSGGIKDLYFAPAQGLCLIKVNY